MFYDVFVVAIFWRCFSSALVNGRFSFFFIRSRLNNSSVYGIIVHRRDKLIRAVSTTMFRDIFVMVFIFWGCFFPDSFLQRKIILCFRMLSNCRLIKVIVNRNN